VFNPESWPVCVWEVFSANGASHGKSATGRIRRGEPGATPKAFGAESAIQFRRKVDDRRLIEPRF